MAYPLYRKYISALLSIFLLALPAAVGVGYGVYQFYPFDIAFLAFFVALLLAVISFLLYFYKLKCPRCHYHSMGLQWEATEIISLEFVYQHFFVHCRNCQYSQHTDLALKSNILIKKIPVKVDVAPSDEH